MKIQYCSDLHIELELNREYLINNPLKVSGEILILAGDIIPLHNDTFNNTFFNYISDNYKQVFWVPGNHEFYHKDLAEFSHSYNLKSRSNVNLVNNISVEYNDIQFVFSTLWSKISAENEKNIEQKVSDFDCIINKNRNFRAADMNELHQKSLEFIKDSLQHRKKKTVVVTHYLPSNQCNSQVHKYSPINEAFCVELTDYIEECGANFWIYGHSHFNQKPLFIGKTILLTNQLGYLQWNEHGTFKDNAYFSI